MKKLGKFLASVTVFLGGLSLVNKYIFDKWGKEENPENVFESEYGNINYIVKGEGKPVLLLHAPIIGGSLEEFKYNIDFLSLNHKVYAIDLLGFGNSQKVNISLSSYLYVNLIKDFVIRVIGKKTDVIASSQMGGIMLKLSSMEKDYFNKLILINPTGFKKRKEKKLYFLLDLPIVGTSVYNIITSKTFIRWYYENILTYEMDYINNEDIEKSYEYCHQSCEGTKYALSSVIGGFLDLDIKDLLEKTDKNVTVIWGNKPEAKLPENIGEIVFKGTGKLPHYQHSAKFNSVISEILEG